MERSLCHSKMVQNITDIRGIESSGSSFDSHVDEVRRVTGDCSYILRTLPTTKALLVSNPAPPMLYGLPKVHKSNMPSRRVVVYILRTRPIKKALLVSNPAPPMLYSLPKVHKSNMPSSSVASYVSAPTYPLPFADKPAYRARLYHHWFTHHHTLKWERNGRRIRETD